MIIIRAEACIAVYSNLIIDRFIDRSQKATEALVTAIEQACLEKFRGLLKPCSGSHNTTSVGGLLQVTGAA